MSTTQVTPVDNAAMMAMMDRAETESATSSVMSCLHTLKIYNPTPGDMADPEKAGKFKLKEAVTGDEKFIDGEVKFNVLSISYNWSGDIYPTGPDGSISDEEVKFTSSEFGKYEKRTDPIGIFAKKYGAMFYTKSEFEAMIKSPMLRVLQNPKDPNSKYIDIPNQFYEKKKDKDGKPYHGTLLRRSGIIYGQFIGGQYDKEYFRMFTSPNNIGITYDAEAGVAIEANEGTLEYVTVPALVQMNEIRAQNGKKGLSRVSHDQCDVLLTIRTNDKGNFLPVFSFAGLTAMRGYDNSEDIKFIHDLKAEQFRSMFGQMGTIAPILIDGTKATVTLPEITHVAEHHEAIAAPKAGLTEADIEATFDGPSKEDF